MAGFRTHITVSTTLGVGYGSAAYALFDVPFDQCLLAGGLCSVGGMLPDLDSDSGMPLRESLAFGAAVVPMLLIDRFRHLGLSTDMMVLAGAVVYLFVRFVLGHWLKRYTKHRGMFHSVPAAIIFAELAFLICDCETLGPRLFKAGAVLLGVMSHLILDELWSVDFRRGLPRLKSSFGTAMKFWNRRSLWSNVSTYGKLAVLTWVVVNEPYWTARPSHGHFPFGRVAEHTQGESHSDRNGEPVTRERPEVAEEGWWESLFR